MPFALPLPLSCNSSLSSRLCVPSLASGQQHSYRGKELAWEGSSLFWFRCLLFTSGFSLKLTSVNEENPTRAIIIQPHAHRTWLHTMKCVGLCQLTCFWDTYVEGGNVPRVIKSNMASVFSFATNLITTPGTRHLHTSTRILMIPNRHLVGVLFVLNPRS